MSDAFEPDEAEVSGAPACTSRPQVAGTVLDRRAGPEAFAAAAWDRMAGRGARSSEPRQHAMQQERPEIFARVQHDPAVMGGKPCIRGLRVTVGTIVGLLGAGRSIEEVLAAYPYLTRDDVLAALTYAAWRAEEIDVRLEAS